MPIINWTNITDFGDLPAAANTSSEGTFWAAMLYMCWIILILILIGNGFEVALVVASFLALIAGVLLVYGNLMSWQFVLPFIGIIISLFLYILWISPKTKN